MNTIIKLLVIAFTVAAIGLFMHKANAQSTEQDNKQTIEQYTTELINECSVLFDSGDTTTKHSILCDKVVTTIDKQCRDNYFGFCFGEAWNNFFSSHAAEAKKKQCKKFEDGSKQCIGDKVKYWTFKVVNGKRVITGEHTCIVKNLTKNNACKGRD